MKAPTSQPVPNEEMQRQIQIISNLRLPIPFASEINDKLQQPNPENIALTGRALNAMFSRRTPAWYRAISSIAKPQTDMHSTPTIPLLTPGQWALAFDRWDPTHENIGHYLQIPYGHNKTLIVDLSQLTQNERIALKSTPHIAYRFYATMWYITQFLESITSINLLSPTLWQESTPEYLWTSMLRNLGVNMGHSFLKSFGPQSDYAQKGQLTLHKRQYLPPTIQVFRNLYAGFENGQLIDALYNSLKTHIDEHQY